MKKKITLILLLLGISILSFWGWQAWHRQEASKKFVQEPVPTLFFHGGGSSYHAEKHMVRAVKRAGASKKAIIAFVDKKGKVRLQGKLKKSDKNPLVMVNFDDSTNANFNERGRYASNVVKALQKVYTFKKVNMVGHSAGNIAAVYYMLQNGQDKSMPQVQKYVAIAGHFAGLNFQGVPEAIRQPSGLKLDKDGKPNKMNASYQEMTKLRETYPKGQTAIINLIGDIGGQTDGTVPNVSSLSLKYLVSPFAKSYEERTFTGPKASHSKLHSNPEVDKVLIDFLWGT